MSGFASDLIVTAVFAGILQAILALPVAAVLCLPRRRGSLLRLFALFNLFLFAWSVFGGAAWLRVTEHRLAVLDDAPVWSAVFPFGRAMLDHAAGGSDGWQLLGGTSMSQLRVLWGVRFLPVWVLAGLSSCGWLRLRSERHLHSPA